MERKIEHWGGLSRNVTIGYCPGYRMSASSLTVKPGNYPCVCMPIVDKIKRNSEVCICGRNKRVCLNFVSRNIVYYLDIKDCCCQDGQE